MSRELIKLDLPTFDLPRNAISGCESEGQSFSLKALFKNSALVTFIYVLGAQAFSPACDRSGFDGKTASEDACAPSI